MKRKLVSVLLALTLCGSLAIPAFAEPTEESTMPETTTPLEVVAPEGGEVLTGGKEFAGDECEHWLANCDIEVTTPEGHTVTVTFWEPCDGSCEDPMLAAASSVATAQLSVPCPKCGKVDWDDGKVESVNLVNLNNKDVHGIDAVIVYECQTCRVKAKYEDKWSEPHSLNKYDFGDNYHKGTLHYVEWYCRCACGYTTTKWESQSCPGNNNGEGCIFGINKVEPPVEVQDVTEPEEVQPQEGTEPEEVITPEESVLPEETVLPEEIT